MSHQAELGSEKMLMILVNVQHNAVRIFLFCVLSFISIAIKAEENSIPWRNTELVIKGDYLHASVVAYSDFFQHLKNQKEISTTSIDNYNIEISVGDSRYYILFYPRLSKEYPAGFGGDAQYIIDSKTFEIIEKQYGK
jgi:hypothetical protein